MQFGLQLNSQHPATENMRDRLQELLEQVHLAQAAGFHSIVAPQHYLPAPFQMLQPLPLLARMAAEAKQMRLIAGIMLLSLQNPVALAEDIGTEANHSPRKSPSVGSCSSPRTATQHCAPVCRIWERKYQTYVSWGQSGALPQEDTLDLRFDELRDQRFIIGSPDDCVEQLRLYRQGLGANHFLLRVQWAGMPQKQVLEAITLVGERIIPYLRDV